MPAGRILVAEDNPHVLALWAAMLERAGHEVTCVSSGAAAEQSLRTSAIDLLVTDLKLPAPGGLDLLRIAKQIDARIGVVLITGYPSVDTAVEAMKAGAVDYLVKPFSAEHLLALIASTLEAVAAREAYALLRTGAQAFTVGGMVGRSRRMLELLDRARRAAAVDANVLILGESGAGKERVARTLHDNSARANGPFVAMNCTAIPETLLEEELLEAAHGGSLFLDELCELHPVRQAKLLRAIEEGGVRRLGSLKPAAFDVRFISSTNRDIAEYVRRERFRADLFFRLAVIELHVPPLRERREDIPLLAAYFLQASAGRRSATIEGFTSPALDALTAYTWPGNVRELRNVVERAAAFAREALITPADLPDSVIAARAAASSGTLRQWKQHAVRRLERQYITRALEDHGGNISRTARALGVHRSTLQRLMRRQGPPSGARAAEGGL
jgi:DNA-binding NtrC family response regulator